MMTRSTVPNEPNLRVLQAIHAYMAEHHFAPALRDLMALVHVSSTSAINYRVRALEEAGYLTRIPNVARSIVITERGQALLYAVGQAAHTHPARPVRRISSS